MTTPRSSTVWAELTTYIRPNWYDDALDLCLGYTRLAVAYDVLVSAPDGNPDHPSVQHVRALLLPYQPSHYQFWRERLYAKSLRPELGVLFQELANAHRTAAGMVASAVNRDEVQKCYREALRLRDADARNTALHEFWKAFVEIWEEFVHTADQLNEDGQSDDDHTRYAQDCHNIRKHAHLPPYGDGTPEAQEKVNRTTL